MRPPTMTIQEPPLTGQLVRFQTAAPQLWPPILVHEARAYPVQVVGGAGLWELAYTVGVEVADAREVRQAG